MGAVAIDTSEATDPRAPNAHQIQRLAVYILEVLDGTRAIGQLGNTITVEVHDELVLRRAAELERRLLYGDERRSVACPGPVHLHRLRPEVIEGTLTLHLSTGARCAAFRFELRGTRWQASVFTIL